MRGKFKLRSDKCIICEKDQKAVHRWMHRLNASVSDFRDVGSEAESSAHLTDVGCKGVIDYEGSCNISLLIQALRLLVYTLLVCSCLMHANLDDFHRWVLCKLKISLKTAWRRSSGWLVMAHILLIYLFKVPGCSILARRCQMYIRGVDFCRKKTGCDCKAIHVHDWLLLGWRDSVSWVCTS